MSWDSGNVDFSAGNAQVDFSAGNAQMEWGNDNSTQNNFAQNDFAQNDFAQNDNAGNNFGGSSNFGNDSHGGEENTRSQEDRPPRRELTEEQMQHRSYKWASNRARYEYNENALDEHGMAPRDEALEAELFGEGAADHTGLDFSKYKNIPVRVERGSAPSPIPNFDAADLHPVMKENLRLAHYSIPTPVQTYSIPIVTAGKDLMACAQTGSGKTAAFLVPTLSSLFYNAKELQKPRPAPYEYRTYKAEPLVLIVAPTRELCSQIFDECRKLTYRSSLRPCAVYGGADSIGQIRQIERGCDILAAAPGRLMDFIQRGKISLARVKYLILDEADRMLDMGFEAIIRNIIEKNGMNPDRQTLLFSATFPRAIRALARDFLKPDYLFLKVGRVGGTSSSITQKIMYVEEEEKREALRTLLNSQPPSRTLIFVETKRSADSLDHYLYERSFPSTSIHGDRTQMEREDALLAFKSGKCPILVATAVAARGIDIKNVMHVINYDMPQDMDEYIHRIGRTARVGKAGLATSFYNSRSDMLAPELTKLLVECKQEIPDFLQSYVTEDITFDEDLDDNDVEAPSYAGQEYIPMERNVPGAPQGYNNAEGTGAADEAWDSGNRNTGRPGDWNCPSCGVSNFASRFECFKCSTPKPEGEGGDSGYGNDDYGGGRQSNSRPGDWDCPDCQQSNFASRFECFKCGAARPEGMGAPRREPRARREGDWDCSSCSAVNFASRSECFKCHAAKDGEAGGYGDYGYGDSGNAGGYGDSGNAGGFGDSGNADFGNTDAGNSGNWDSAAATGGWASSSEPANTATNEGSWGASESTTPAATNGTSGGWGASETSAPAPSSGGWGASEPVKSTPPPRQQSSPAPQAGGWGASETSAPAPQAGGWGASETSAPAPQAGGWGAPEPVKATPPPQQSPAPQQQPPAQAGGWGAPEANAPAPQAGGWGAPEPVKATPPPQAGGWGAPEPVKNTPPPQHSPAPQAGGWGAPEPVKATPPPQQQSPAPQQPPAQSGGWGAPAASGNEGGWGSAPAATGNDGWGAAPSNSNGSGW